MATIRKKQCLVGQLANAMWKKYDHINDKVDPNDDSDETLEECIKLDLDIYKKIENLKEVCEVDDNELIGIMKAIVRQYIDRNNEQ
mgnify:CR=1 FL=1